MSSYWKHKNMNVFEYNTDKAAGPAEERQALSDWSRHVISGKACTYFIDGKSVADIRAQELGTQDPKQLAFKDVDELRTFFVKHLFVKVEDKQQQITLANLAIAHFHQTGLTHATNFCIKNLGNENPRMKVGDPKTKIDFTPTQEGVKLVEANTYNKWQQIVPGVARPKEHVRTREHAYYAKTETSYLLTAKDIQVTDLTIDCPSKNLAPIFDKREEGQQIYRAVYFLRELVAGIIVSMMKNSLKETSAEPLVFPHQP